MNDKPGTASKSECNIRSVVLYINLVFGFSQPDGSLPQELCFGSCLRSCGLCFIKPYAKGQATTLTVLSLHTLHRQFHTDIGFAARFIRTRNTHLSLAGYSAGRYWCDVPAEIDST